MTAPTVALSAFDSLVLPYAPGAPYPLARKMLRLAAIEFCERTRCWREMVTVTVDEQNETIVAPDHAAIHLIEEATWGDQTPLTPTQFTDTTLYDRREEDTGCPPSYITQTHPNTVALIPYAAGTLNLSLFLKPRADSSMTTEVGTGRTIDARDVVPDFLFKQFANPLTDGALARLLMVPAQPFTNPIEAERRRMLFREACDMHFASDLSMQHSPPPRTRMSEF